MYRVFKGSLFDLPENAKHFYYNSDVGFVLMFTRRKPKGYKLISKEEELTLPADAKEWLLMRRIEINATHVKNHKEEYVDFLSTYINLINEELEREKENG